VRVQSTRPAVAAALALELGVQVGEVQRLERSELHAADGRQGVQLQQPSVAVKGLLVAAEDLHVLEPEPDSCATPTPISRR
jgi:hypothetical protein